LFKRKFCLTLQKAELLRLRCCFILETLTENLLGFCNAHLVAPLYPALAGMTGEEFEVKGGAALLDNLIRFAGLVEIIRMARENAPR